jgi:hypothetical protein
MANFFYYSVHFYKNLIEFPADNSLADFVIGESFIDGQQRDLWCRSKIPLTDPNMHYGGAGKPYLSVNDGFTKSASCFKVHYNGTISKLVLYGDTCQLKALNQVDVYFLCE